MVSSAANALKTRKKTPRSVGTEFKTDFLIRSSRRHLFKMHWGHLVYGMADVGFLLLNAVLVFRILSPALAVRHATTNAVPPYLAVYIVYCALLLLASDTQELYETSRNRSAFDESVAVGRAVLLPTVLCAFFIYLADLGINRFAVAIFSSMNLLTLIAWRHLRRAWTSRRISKGLHVRNALIIGTGEVAQALAAYLKSNPHLGYVTKGFVGKEDCDMAIGSIDDLPYLVRAYFIDEVFITNPSDKNTIKQTVFEARLHHFNVKVIPEMYDGVSWNTPLDHLGIFPVLALDRESIPMFWLTLKRVIDIALSIFALVLCSPIMVLLAIIIKLDSKGSVIYGSPRVGRRNVKFICYKFRTMVNNADELRNELEHLNEREGILFKISNDPRLTKIGKQLRRYSLDELPQFWNVLKGDMSLVGPRPPLPAEVQQYDLEHLRRLDVTPGITGLWQVNARHHSSFDSYIALDMEYIDNWSFSLDLKILLKTVYVVFQGTGR